MIAALFVHRNGAYYGIPDVDPWPEDRDARLYPGPHPVVAHPPCERWVNLGAMNYSRWGGEHNRPGNDGGCFASALDSVLRWGGVIEHPAYSMAWARFGLPRPNRHGGWTAGLGGWSAHVEQGQYGHPARKATWLFVHGPSSLPVLRWGPSEGRKALVSWCGNHLRGRPNDRPRVSKAKAAATPLEFRDVLLGISRSVEVAP
jgi:hypothetical protein